MLLIVYITMHARYRLQLDHALLLCGTFFCLLPLICAERFMHYIYSYPLNNSLLARPVFLGHMTHYCIAKSGCYTITTFIE